MYAYAFHSSSRPPWIYTHMHFTNGNSGQAAGVGLAWYRRFSQLAVFCGCSLHIVWGGVFCTVLEYYHVNTECKLGALSVAHIVCGAQCLRRTVSVANTVWGALYLWLSIRLIFLLIPTCTPCLLYTCWSFTHTCKSKLRTHNSISTWVSCLGGNLSIHTLGSCQ